MQVMQSLLHGSWKNCSNEHSLWQIQWLEHSYCMQQSMWDRKVLNVLTAVLHVECYSKPLTWPRVPKGGPTRHANVYCIIFLVWDSCLLYSITIYVRKCRKRATVLQFCGSVWLPLEVKYLTKHTCTYDAFLHLPVCRCYSYCTYMMYFALMFIFSSLCHFGGRPIAELLF